MENNHLVLPKVKKKVESRKYPLPFPSWLLVAVQWFSPGTLVSSTNKSTDRHNITVILLKVVLNTVTPLTLISKKVQNQFH
jgi:hypothetical protein